MTAYLRLVRVELRRLQHRRAALLLLAACVAVPALIAVSTLIDTRSPSAEQVAQTKQELLDEARAMADDPDMLAQIDACAAAPEDWDLPDYEPLSEGAKAACREEVIPDSSFAYTMLWNTLDLDGERKGGSGTAVAAVLAIALLLAGTTFTGHDWASRSVSNQLLFDPRRGRVWSAKALVVTATALFVAAGIMTAYWLVLGAFASSRGTLKDGQLLDALQMGWRTAFVVAGAAFFGFALTTLLRSTVATIGILLGVTVAGTVLLAAVGVSERWNPATNLAAVIDDGVTIYDASRCYEASAGFFAYAPQDCSDVITFADGSLYVGSVVLLTAAVSFSSFRRRDVP